MPFFKLYQVNEAKNVLNERNHVRHRKHIIKYRIFNIKDGFLKISRMQNYLFSVRCYSMLPTNIDIPFYDFLQSDAELYLKPLIGLTAEQLKIAQQSTFWRFWRITIIVLFWLIWTAMVTGAIVIIVLNNGDVPKTTTTTVPRTTAHQ